MLEVQAAQVGFNARSELIGVLGEPERDRAPRVRVRSDLRHDRDAVRGCDGLAQQSVDEAVAVEVGGVDVVDAELDGPS